MFCNNPNFLDIDNQCPANATLQFCGEPNARKVILDFDSSSIGTGLVSSSANNTYTGTNTFNGNVSLNGNNVIGNAPTDTLGFYGATPIVRPTAITQTYATASATLAARTAATLTDSTTGTANTTVQDVTNAFSQTILNNNFADLTAQINALKVDSDNNAQVLNSVIDKLQALGLFA